LEGSQVRYKKIYQKSKDEQNLRAYDDYRIGIEKAIKTDSRSFFLGTLISKKGSESLMILEDQSASGSQKICDLFAKFIKWTYVDWVVNDEPPFSRLHFTVLEVKSTLLELDNSKFPGADGVPPLILKNGAYASLHALQQVIGNVYLPR
jgi:hypothetical protein